MADTSTREPRLWLFQMPPQSWNLWKKQLQAGEEGWFEVKRFKKEIKAGDKALLWVSGPKAGAYGRTSIITDPAPHSSISGIDYQSDAGALWVRLGRVVFMDRHLPRERLKRDPVLSSSSIITSPMGSVHQFKPNEVKQIRQLLGA
jgi:predicted RNA-binding protein with PUA-like domain